MNIKHANGSLIYIMQITNTIKIILFSGLLMSIVNAFKFLAANNTKNSMNNDSVRAAAKVEKLTLGLLVSAVLMLLFSVICAIKKTLSAARLRSLLQAIQIGSQATRNSHILMARL